MPILPPQVPGDGATVIGNALARISLRPGAISGEMGKHGAAEGTFTVEVAAPHPVFVAGLEGVTGRRLLETARPDGWRYLLLRNDRAVGSATVERDAAGDLAFSHVTRGPYVQSTLEGVSRAERLPEVDRADFELRLLDLPVLPLRALWLRGERQDILLPLPPVPPPLDPYRPYSEDELVEAVRESALRLLSHADDQV